MHKRIIRVALTLCLTCVLCTSCHSQAKPVAPSNAPAESRLPDDFFPIMTWELPPRSAGFEHPTSGLKSVAECGFTTASFVSPKLVPQCKKLGLRTIVFGGDDVRRWKNLSDEQIERAVANLVRGTEREDTVLG